MSNIEGFVEESIYNDLINQYEEAKRIIQELPV